MSDPMQDFLDDPHTYETTDEENRRTAQEAKRYKVAKPGDPGVISVGFDDAGNVKQPQPPTMPRAMAKARAAAMRKAAGRGP